MKKLGIIGFGQMGSALGRGVSQRQPHREWGAYDKLSENLQKARDQGGRSFSSVAELAEWSEVVVLAVKPQDLPSVCGELKPWAGKKLVISVAAGFPLGRMISLLQSSRVSRWMPNLAASVGECLVGIAHPDKLSGEDAQESLELAQALGGGLILSEKLLHAVTGVSGSGLAFVFSFIQGLTLGGVQQGMTYSQALALATQTCLGAVKLLQSTQQHPEQMISQVCSPAGTTIEGIRLLQNSGFQGMVMEAVIQAAERSAEIEMAELEKNS